ncbi:MAG: MBL fold metallo-hydrolase [Acidimicrobiales bacterium]
MRYGGNTSCVALEVGDEPPIVFDLGTGLRPLGHELEDRYGEQNVRLTGFLTHLHWDHIIGLPFCRPILKFGGHMDVYGPVQHGEVLGDAIDRVVVPPFFPVQVSELHGSLAFHEVGDDVIPVGSAKVTVRKVPHVGDTLGFRVDADGFSFAYVSDHQQPEDRSTIADAVMELCDGVDMLVHDAQYTEEEFAVKATWGHSTIAYAVQVAAEAGARRLVLFHHDPVHTDDDMDCIVSQALSSPGASKLDGIVAAAEGLTLDLTKR